MASSGHLPPSQGVNLSIGGENKANTEREKEQRDEEKEGTLKMSAAWIDQDVAGTVGFLPSSSPSAFVLAGRTTIQS